MILADEPTGELDRGSADVVYDLLAALARRTGATLLVVSHDPGAARIADRVVHVRDGRVSEEGGALVIDDRGWLRLPGDLCHRLGHTANATDGDGAVVLRPAGPARRAAFADDVAAAAELGRRARRWRRLDGVSHEHVPREVTLDLAGGARRCPRPVAAPARRRSCAPRRASRCRAPAPHGAGALRAG